MKQTAVELLVQQLVELQYDLRLIPNHIKHAIEKEKKQLKDAYQHGRDDENCALSDGAMCPDYDNADEWYQGEYGGDK